MAAVLDFCMFLDLGPVFQQQINLPLIWSGIKSGR